MYIYMHTYYVNTSPHSSLFLCLCMYVSQTHIYVYTTVFNILNYLFNFAYLLNVISLPTTMTISSTISAPPVSLFPWLAYWPVPQRREGKRRKNRERRSSKHFKYLSPFLFLSGVFHSVPITEEGCLNSKYILINMNFLAHAHMANSWTFKSEA